MSSRPCLVPALPVDGLDDLAQSLCAAHDMLAGVETLLTADDTAAARRSARALLGLAMDMVAQAGELARTLQR